MDEEKHKRYTGVSNVLILENLERLSSWHREVIIRMPVIPGINDDDENIRKTALFVSSLHNVKEIHLLPYHKTGIEKYERVNLEYCLPETEPPSQGRLDEIAKKIMSFGICVKIGG
jgi:pyruvate formate lyase activating enzyme